MIGPYELDILFFESQAEVEASSVDLGQAFINEYASFRVGLVRKHGRKINIAANIAQLTLTVTYEISLGCGKGKTFCEP